MKKLSPGQIQNELRLASEAHARGDAQAAMQSLDAILSSDHGRGEAHFGKGLIFASVGRHEEALAAFSEAVRCDANNGEAISTAALAAINLRRPVEAEKFARRLVHLEPKNHRAHFLLSIAFSIAGRLPSALESMNAALELEPSELNYIVGKAQLLRKLNDSSLSIQWYRKALRIETAPQIAKELAEVLLEENQVEEAISLLEGASRELPEDAQPHALMGRAYTEAHRFDEAADQWDSASRLTRDPLGLLELRARTEISAGRLAVAESILRQAVSENPSTAQFYGLLTTVTKITEQDSSLVENMERLLVDGSEQTLARQSLNYALGKAFHDLGDYGKAISFFDEANRLRGEIAIVRRNFDPSDWRDFTDYQIGYFTKERVASLAARGLESKRPLFILGMIRSGTTLTEQILSAHHRVKDGGEKTFWQVNRQLAGAQAGRLDFEVVKRLGRDYLGILGRFGSDIDYVTDKHPLNYMVAATLHCLYPNAKIVHVKRHPVDNLLSIWLTPITTDVGSKEELVFIYRQYQRLFKHLEEVLPETSFKTFAYEDITGQPRATIGKMLDFLDLETDENCFHPELNRRTVRTPSVFQVRQPINTQSQERWRRYEPWLGPFAEFLDEKSG